MFMRAAGALVMTTLALVGSSEHAPAKTLVQNQIQYGRLSPELRDSDPLFAVVVAGTPTSNFIALLSTSYEACVLEVIDAANNKAVLTIADHVSCAREYEFEDGYSRNHAHQFREFLNHNTKTLQQILTRYKIDYSKLPDAVEMPKRDGDKSSTQCIKLVGLMVCKSKNQRAVATNNR